MRIPRLFAAVAFLPTLACAEPIANRCPDSRATGCMAGTVCTTDPVRGCQVCRCSTPYEVPPTQPPQGAPQPLGQ
jgi:hypothetical protein